MSSPNDNWLIEILEDAAEKVKNKPDWMRSPELLAELRRLDAHREASAENAPAAPPRDPRSSST